MLEVDTNFTVEVFDDTYLNMDLAIPRDGYGPGFTKVTKGLRDKDGLTIVKFHNNPILDTRLYEVEYKDRHKVLLSANAIEENIFAQLDEEVNRHVLFQDIFDHGYNGTEVKEQDAFITTRTKTKASHIENKRRMNSSSNGRMGKKNG